MSSTFARSINLPCLANWAIAPGPGRPARSGGLPAETRVVSTALRSRVPSYCILAPEASSHGLTSDMNVCCSSPPQVASTLTVPPTFWIWGAAAGTGEPAAVAVPVAPAVDVPAVPAVLVPVVPAALVPTAAVPVGWPAAATDVAEVGAPLVVVAAAPATGVVAVVVAAEPLAPTPPVAAAAVDRAAAVGLAAPPQACSSGTATSPRPTPSTERRPNGRSTNLVPSNILTTLLRSNGARRLGRG